MTTMQIVDEYFLENRAKVLDLAAFLDRLDRSADGEDGDFRVEAMKRAITVLLDAGPGRARRVHMILSDATEDAKPALDRKAAYGAFNPASREVL